MSDFGNPDDSDDYAAGDPDDCEIVFDVEFEKAHYVESAKKRCVWADGYFRMCRFVADALAILGPDSVCTTRPRAGAGGVYLLLHGTKHVFKVLFESLPNKGQYIDAHAETLHEKLHAFIPIYIGFESPRGWSKVLRQVAWFEGINYCDEFILEEQQWEEERLEREEERRRQREQEQDEDEDEDDGEATT